MAGDALMYLGSFYAWLKHLAQAGVDCSILSVDYPLSPEHPFPCAVDAVAGTIEWLLQDSGESCDYIVGECGTAAVPCRNTRKWVWLVLEMTSHATHCCSVSTLSGKLPGSCGEAASLWYTGA